jgi:hypothetical protein
MPVADSRALWVQFWGLSDLSLLKTAALYLIRGVDRAEPAIDPSGRRLVLNSAGYMKSNRLFVINFDPPATRCPSTIASAIPAAHVRGSI